MMELVASFGLGRVHLVGHSMGGYLAQLAMCRHPERVLTATSISAGSTVVPEAMRRLGMSAPAEATWQVLWNNKPTGDFERDLPGWLSVWRFLNGVCPFDEELAIRYTRALYVGDSCNAQFAVNHIHAVSTLPVSLEQDIRCAETPLLVIHGTKDPLVPPDNGEATARLARYSRIHLLQGAGHMFFHIDIWREICKVLLTHIRQDLSGRCTPTALTGCQ
jgi:pimeloyl-ACP methyl ester carboxylesterase